MITLYQGPAAFGLPNLSPFCVKLETWLRLVDVPYEVGAFDVFKAPKGKMPYVRMPDGSLLGDSGDVIDALVRDGHAQDLDDGLSPTGRADALLIRRTLEEHTYWALTWSRWVDEAGWRSLRPKVAATLPPVVAGPMVDLVLRRKVRRDLAGQGLGLHDGPDVLRRGVLDIEALGAKFEGPFVMGDQPRTVDATVFAWLASIWVPPIASPLKDAVGRHDALVAYVGRMMDRCHPDTADDGPSLNDRRRRPAPR